MDLTLAATTKTDSYVDECKPLPARRFTSGHDTALWRLSRSALGVSGGALNISSACGLGRVNHARHVILA